MYELWVGNPIYNLQFAYKVIFQNNSMLENNLVFPTKYKPE